jgi:HEAT repeat protein
MDSLRFVELATVAMAGLIALMVIITLGVKAARYLKVSWYKRHFRRIEPALENFVLTGEDQPELSLLPPWQRDLFLSRLIIERMILLQGIGREYLMRLAREMGLVDRYLGAPHSRRRWRRARAAESLGYFGGEEAVGPLGELLSDEDETIQAVAARALARIGSDEAVRLLARTLDDPSELTRLRVAENLERVGHPAVKPLMDLLENAESLGVEQLHGPVMAARVLGNLRAAEAREVLRGAARNDREDDLRAQATLTLGKIGDPEDVPTLLESARDESWPVQAQAANALGMIGEVSTVPTLKKLATDEEWWVRLNAAKALANIGPEGEKALLELLQEDDRYARERAAATLEARGVTRRMVRQLAAPGRRGERARIVVGAVAGSGVTKYLRGLAETLPDGEERRILRQMLEVEDESERPEGAEPPGTALAKMGRDDDGPAKAERASAEPPGAAQIHVTPANVDESLGVESASTLRKTGGQRRQRTRRSEAGQQQPSEEEEEEEEQVAVIAKGEDSHIMSMFRRSVSKGDKNTNTDVRPLPTSSAQSPQPSESPESGALTEETLEGRLKNAGDGVIAASDYRRRLAREDEAIGKLIQDLDEYVEQISTMRSKLEEDAARISKLCERFEYETAEVDSLRAQIEEKIIRIRDVAESRETKPEIYRPDEPQLGSQ